MTQVNQTCEICAQRTATTYMVVREKKVTAKGFVCMDCFQGCQETIGGMVEAVSLQDFKETKDDRLPAPPGQEG